MGGFAWVRFAPPMLPRHGAGGMTRAVTGGSGETFLWIGSSGSIDRRGGSISTEVCPLEYAWHIGMLMHALVRV